MAFSFATGCAKEEVKEPEVDMEQEQEQEQEEEQVYVPERIEITISAVGDITLGTNQKTSYGGSFTEYYDNYGESYFLQNVKDVFASDDFTIGNLEGTLTNSNNIRTTKEWNHKGKPEYVSILKNAFGDEMCFCSNKVIWSTISAAQDPFTV